MRVIKRRLLLTVMAFLTTSLLAGSYLNCERYIINPEDGISAHYKSDNLHTLS